MESFILIIVNGKLQRVDPLPIIISSYQPPFSLLGIPVLEDLNNRRFVLLSHLLDCVLICHCSSTNHFGMFKTKHMKEYRIKVDITSLFKWWNHETYDINKLTSDSTAILMEGVEKWVKNGKMAKFINREHQKCIKKGCFK
jgi:hypothetical protein